MPRPHVDHERPRRVVILAVALTGALAAAVERTRPQTAKLLAQRPELFYENFPGAEGARALLEIEGALLGAFGADFERLADGTRRFRWPGAEAAAGADQVLVGFHWGQTDGPSVGGRAGGTAFVDLEVDELIALTAAAPGADPRPAIAGLVFHEVCHMTAGPGRLNGGAPDLRGLPARCLRRLAGLGELEATACGMAAYLFFQDPRASGPDLAALERSLLHADSLWHALLVVCRDHPQARVAHRRAGTLHRLARRLVERYFQALRETMQSKGKD